MARRNFIALAAIASIASITALAGEAAAAKETRTEMPKSDRSTPLPDAMQGIWRDVDDGQELTVAGANVTYAGRSIEYDYKVVGDEDGALTVSLKVNDPGRDDAFQRENFTELVVTPDGEFHAYNVKFASQFERIGD